VGDLELAGDDPLSPDLPVDRVSGETTTAGRSAPAAELEQKIGYQFGDPALLREALTHSSSTAGGARRAKLNNERLEFLGDRVLGLAVADLLFRRFPRESEGALSKRHAALVRGETLAEIAAGLDLGRWLVFGRSEEDAGGRAKPATLANGLEALIGALFRDGGLAAAEAFIWRHWRGRLRAMQAPPRDAKTTLQEWAQGRGLALPEYRVVETSGPAHAPRFDVVVSVTDLPPARATGGSKRAAEQAAALRLLSQLAEKLEPADG
jgi:ribonuclease-3